MTPRRWRHSPPAMKLPPISWSPTTDTYLENIVVTKKGTGPANTTGPYLTCLSPAKGPRFRAHESGRKTHSSEVVSGRRSAGHIHLHAVPFSRLLPAGLQKFRAYLRRSCARIRPSVQKMRLLSVSFDPAHDTPAVLKRNMRKHSTAPPAAIRLIAGNSPLFPPRNCPKVANFFGLYYSLARRSDRPLDEHQRDFARWHHLQVVRG